MSIKKKFLNFIDKPLILALIICLIGVTIDLNMTNWVLDYQFIHVEEFPNYKEYVRLTQASWIEVNEKNIFGNQPILSYLWYLLLIFGFDFLARKLKLKIGRIILQVWFAFLPYVAIINNYLQLHWILSNV